MHESKTSDICIHLYLIIVYILYLSYIDDKI